MSTTEPARRKSRRRRGFGPPLPVTWQDDADCRGPQAALFFPPAAENPDDRIEREAEAKSICRPCSVRSKCLDYAVIRGENFGIWGGLTEGERRPLRAKSS